MNDDDLKDISIDQRQSNSQSAVRLPGDRIRIEQHRISADNFAATAYLPENQVPASPLTVMAAVDIETDYVLGVKVTFDPTADDAVELLATAMRDKNGMARRWFGWNGSWQGWCIPRQVEVGPSSPFLDGELRDRLASAGIEVQEWDRTLLLPVLWRWPGTPASTR